MSGAISRRRILQERNHSKRLTTIVNRLVGSFVKFPLDNLAPLATSGHYPRMTDHWQLKVKNVWRLVNAVNVVTRSRRLDVSCV